MFGMTMIKGQAQSWKEILQHYQGQSYSIIYKAFGNLRHRLIRKEDAPWFRYTF